jgi:hypothetical protein
VPCTVTPKLRMLAKIVVTVSVHVFHHDVKQRRNEETDHKTGRDDENHTHTFPSISVKRVRAMASDQKRAIVCPLRRISQTSNPCLQAAWSVKIISPPKTLITHNTLYESVSFLKSFNLAGFDCDFSAFQAQRYKTNRRFGRIPGSRSVRLGTVARALQCVRHSRRCSFAAAIRYMPAL